VADSFGGTFGIPPSGCSWLITLFVGGSAGMWNRSVGVVTSLSESLELTAFALRVLLGLESLLCASNPGHPIVI
jgi:hypothetical protein